MVQMVCAAGDTNQEVDALQIPLGVPLTGFYLSYLFIEEVWMFTCRELSSRLVYLLLSPPAHPAHISLQLLLLCQSDAFTFFFGAHDHIDTVFMLAWQP